MLLASTAAAFVFLADREEKDNLPMLESFSPGSGVTARKNTAFPLKNGSDIDCALKGRQRKAKFTAGWKIMILKFTEDARPHRQRKNIELRRVRTGLAIFIHEPAELLSVF